MSQLATECRATLIVSPLSTLGFVMTGKMKYFHFEAVPRFGGNVLLHAARAVKCGTCMMAASVVKTA